MLIPSLLFASWDDDGDADESAHVLFEHPDLFEDCSLNEEESDRFSDDEESDRLFDEENFDQSSSGSDEQRYLGIHVKVKDEDLEYDRLYFDQSDDGEKFLIRVKIYGSLDASSSNGELVGSTTPPDMICTWEGSISKDGEKKVDSFKCTGGSNGKIEVDSSLEEGSVEQQCTWAHENAHQQDNITYLKTGFSANLDSKAFDNVSGIEDIRKEWNKVQARIKIVKEARAVLAEVEQIKKIKNLTKEQKEKYLDQLSNNPAVISKITNGGKNITPYEFDTEEIYLGKIRKKDIKIKASSLNGKYVVTYGEAYTQLKGQSLTSLLRNLANEARNILKKDVTSALLESIGKDETLKVEIDKKGTTNVTKKVTFGNNTQQDGSIRGNDDIFALIEKVYEHEIKIFDSPSVSSREGAWNLINDYCQKVLPYMERIIEGINDGNRQKVKEHWLNVVERNKEIIAPVMALMAAGGMRGNQQAKLFLLKHAEIVKKLADI